jgi:hypothetical protein
VFGLFSFSKERKRKKKLVLLQGPKQKKNVSFQKKFGTLPPPPPPQTHSSLVAHTSCIQDDHTIKKSLSPCAHCVLPRACSFPCLAGPEPHHPSFPPWLQCAPHTCARGPPSPLQFNGLAASTHDTLLPFPSLVSVLCFCRVLDAGNRNSAIRLDEVVLAKRRTRVGRSLPMVISQKVIISTPHSSLH